MYFVLPPLSFYRKRLTITQTDPSFSSTTYIHNIVITCHIMIVAVLEIISISQSYKSFMEFHNLIFKFHYYMNNQYSLDKCI